MPGTHSMRWIVCLFCASLAAPGCSTDTPQAGGTGSLSLELVLAEGIVINAVSWEISGDDMDPMSGLIDTSAPGSTASVEVYGLPPGQDYLVELVATSEDGEVICQGSAGFEVEIGASTDVMVFLNCKLPERYGGVRVNGKLNVCAQLHKLVVSPLQTSVGNQIDLFAMGEDEESDSITYIWNGTGGSIADPNAASTAYTCGEVGEQMVTIALSDDDFEHCIDDWTVPVTCVEVDLCDDVDCDDGNACTNDDCNLASGTCINDPVEDGTACDGGTGACSSGQCIEIDLCQEVDCDDGNECTDDACNPVDGSCGNTAVDDGTACNGGVGECVEGNCVDIDLCDGVDCSSGNDCVEDGTCEPSTGMCVDGANKPAGTACGVGGFGACDGAGNCKINICAEFLQVIVSPRQTSVGNQIDLSAVGTDEDGDSIQYFWTGTGGSIADPNAASTTYTCGEVGEQTVTITISDDDFEFCTDDEVFPVTCVEG